MEIQWQAIGQGAKKAASGLFHDIITWAWTKKLLNWIILSAGTGSECAFLVASVWMSVNGNVHLFVLNFLTEQQTRDLSALATIAYIALPECIVFLAVQTTLNHIFLAWYAYKRKDNEMLIVESIWTFLFGLPAILFIVLSLITLAYSVRNEVVNFPDWMVILRALGAYTYAFIAFLYVGNGATKIKKEMAKRDQLIEELKQQNENNLLQLRQQKDQELGELQKELAILNDQTKYQKQLLLEFKEKELRWQNEINKSSDMALEAYGEEVAIWLKSGIKTASIDDITRFTGHSKQKIKGALKTGLLKTSTRNSELILIDSLISWLKMVDMPTGKTGEMPALRIVNNG